ncbi:uncharacterized protein LOC125435052 isoform X1 [Sphaerodactylus townsendi]|uniref:uncharacterized protein LOC125435052 isoform X1 n=1 Tax=Sphaerodactylus townsendi TaxID=933632 RepID=UPI00202650CF|nr:uncharacterized protein LOC125435052 isoform X1 [Sphaerodactylus townsendi]
MPILALVSCFSSTLKHWQALLRDEWGTFLMTGSSSLNNKEREFTLLKKENFATAATTMKTLLGLLLFSVLLATGGLQVTHISKHCSSKSLCEQYKPGAPTSRFPDSTIIKEVTCKAPSFSASLFLTLSGFLLLKILS